MRTWLGLIVVTLAILSTLGCIYALANWVVVHNPATIGWWLLSGFATMLMTLASIVGWALYRDKLWRGLMHPLPFMASLMFLVVGLLMVPGYRKRVDLSDNGQRAVATIHKLRTSYDVDSEGVVETVHRVTYEFQAEDGYVYASRVTVGGQLYRTLSEGDEIVILYTSGRPWRSMPEAEAQPQVYASLILTALFSAVIITAMTPVIVRLVR